MTSKLVSLFSKIDDASKVICFYCKRKSKLGKRSLVCSLFLYCYKRFQTTIFFPYKTILEKEDM